MDIKRIKIRIKEMISKCASDTLIVQTIRKENYRLSKKKTERMVKEVKTELSLDYPRDAANIRALHVKRYNNNILKLLAIKELDFADIALGNITHQQWLASRNRKIKANNDALDSMHQKEQCLQMHSDSFVIEVNEDVEVSVNEKKRKFDATKLTFEEQLEMMELITLCRTDNTEMESVSTRPEYDDEPYTKEIVSSIIPNVDLIKTDQSAIVPSTPIFDPVAKLKQKLNAIAAERFQQAGANLDADEIKFLPNSNN